MKEAPSSALRSLWRGEEPASFRVVPACGEKAVGQAQGNGRPAIAEHIADVLLARLSESKDIRLALCLNRGQLIVGCHYPKPDLILSEEVEQVLPATEDFGRRRA